jgi:peptide/nickel transport system permease protein
MARYIIKRLLITIPVIAIVAALVFTLLHFTPGDPAVMILGESATEAQLEAQREMLGLNQPFIVQLGDYLYRIFIKFDLGVSWFYKTNITGELMNRIPKTASICVYSVLIGAVIGIPLGVTSAVNQNKTGDKIILFCCSVLVCIPHFCIALVLILQFALKLRWLPAYGIGGIKFYILPCVSIMIGSFSGITRLMRTCMLEVIRSDHVISARAQGFSRRYVYYRRALPNALIPIITVLGTQFAAGLGGTLILETIFSIPGVGLYVQGGITRRDYPIVTGSVVFLAILFCLIMLIIDVLYACADPRIKAQYVARARGRGLLRSK